MIKRKTNILTDALEATKASLGISSGSSGSETAREKMERLMKESKQPGAFINEVEVNIEKPDYKEIEVPKIDAEEIKKQAEAEMKVLDIEGRTKIDKEISSAAQELETKKRQMSGSKADKESALDEYFEAAKTSTGNEALKRGLARSSIVLNQLAAIDIAKAQELNNINKQYIDEIDAADRAIEKLAADKENALKSLEATLAAQLTIKISELTEKRDAKIAEAIKYNNTIAEKLSKFNLDKAETEANVVNKNAGTNEKLFEIESSKAYIAYTEKMRYEYAKEYLMGLSKQDALAELRSGSFYSANLTDYYYKLLESELKER